MKPISRRRFVRLSAIATGVAPIVAAAAGGQSNAPSTLPATPAERQTAGTGRGAGGGGRPVADSHREENTTLRIGHCQLESKCGAFETNLGRVVQGLERADREHVEIVCFPECFLTGYPDTEAPARKDAFAVDSPSMLKLLDRTSRF